MIVGGIHECVRNTFLQQTGHLVVRYPDGQHGPFGQRADHCGPGSDQFQCIFQTEYPRQMRGHKFAQTMADKCVRHNAQTHPKFCQRVRY